MRFAINSKNGPFDPLTLLLFEIETPAQDFCYFLPLSVYFTMLYDLQNEGYDLIVNNVSGRRWGEAVLDCGRNFVVGPRKSSTFPRRIDGSCVVHQRRRAECKVRVFQP